MKREADLERQLESLETLHEAVSAMKSLSAHHFRETRATLEPERAYREGIDRVVRSTGAFLPAGSGAIGLLVLGPELGLCGGYGTHVADMAASAREKLGAGPTFAVGRRGATMLTRRGLHIDRSYPAPTSVRGITEALLELSRAVLGDYIELGLSGFSVVSSRFGGVGNHPPVLTSLLPLDLVPQPGAPGLQYVTAKAANLVAARELLYISIHGLLLDAMASEHSARLLATQAAEEWLADKTDHLRRGLSSARREASTQEVVEIAAGARARTNARARAGS